MYKYLCKIELFSVFIIVLNIKENNCRLSLIEVSILYTFIIAILEYCIVQSK